MSLKLALAIVALVVVGWFAAAPATAEEDRGLYVGAKRGTTNVDTSLGDTFRQALRGDESSGALLVGYRLGRFWAIEAAILDLGETVAEPVPCPASDANCPLALPLPVAGETKGYSLSLAPQLPLGLRFTVYGKVGIARLTTKVRPASGSPRPVLDEFSNEELLYGIGARMRLFLGFRLFAEWEKIGDFETKSFGLLFQF